MFGSEPTGELMEPEQAVEGKKDAAEWKEKAPQSRIDAPNERICLPGLSLTHKSNSYRTHILQSALFSSTHVSVSTQKDVSHRIGRGTLGLLPT